MDTKKDFFVKNNILLETSKKQNNLYAEQPQRTACKLCEHELLAGTDIYSHGVGYTFCPGCSHLNGRFQDTESFVEKLYISDDGKNYAENYTDNNYEKRVTDIYMPKVDFLLESLSIKDFSLLDIGCGSGFFVYAANQRNLTATGVDIGKTMIDFGNIQIYQLCNKKPLLHTNEEDFYWHISNSRAQVLSAIGVIEHLRKPHKFFTAFRDSNHKYLFYSVPMFSLSVILENIFQNVFPRQLSGGHTHLFTEQSIKKMNKIIGVKPVAEWRFGTDIMDMYRSFLITLANNNTSQNLINYFEDGFAKNIDEIQSIFDKNHFCSGIHCVVEKE